MDSGEVGNEEGSKGSKERRVAQHEGGGGGRGAGGGCTGECVGRDGWEDSEPIRRFTKSAEKVEAARRAGSPRVETGVDTRRGAGRVGGGWLQTNNDQGLSVPHSLSIHPAKTVLPLAKSRLFYRSRSDPPNWLLMTP